jgi:hypothetical protein
MKQHNPFQFKHPDDTSPQDVIDLFVPFFSDYFNIPEIGHTFINGPRGSGKSMMFRHMRPDCQMLESNLNLKDLNYLGVYIPIKRGQLDKTDIKVAENKHGEALLNEHLMVLHFSITIFKELSSLAYEDTHSNLLIAKKLFSDYFCELLDLCGYEDEMPKFEDISSINDVFSRLSIFMNKILKKFEHGYLKKLIGYKGSMSYDGPIFLYTDFLFDILCKVRNLPFLPNGPIYLLIDDADNLTNTQKKILNSWVSLRTTHEVSLKISTQLKYNTFRTINDSRIDTPHDYSEINLNDIYTSNKGDYINRVRDVIVKRLVKFGYKDVTPEIFFPTDVKQEKKIAEKFAEYEDKKGYDFAYRYSRPDFIKSLSGNMYTYSYAGFSQLVNVSSGIIREFIDFSYRMYNAQTSKYPDEKVNFIEATIQNIEVRKYSDEYFFREFDKLTGDVENDVDELVKLKNLILALGGAFKVILISDASERRVFSVALNDEPDTELKRILDLGVELGYLQKSLIGNKYGTGKSRLYILNRLLAPHFNLDPSSFAGYKFVNASDLKIALTKPKDFIDNIKLSKRRPKKSPTNDLGTQQSIF